MVHRHALCNFIFNTPCGGLGGAFINYSKENQNLKQIPILITPNPAQSSAVTAIFGVKKYRTPIYSRKINPP
jgi:hypothetical protein